MHQTCHTTKLKTRQQQYTTDSHRPEPYGCREGTGLTDRYDQREKRGTSIAVFLVVAGRWSGSVIDHCLCVWDKMRGDGSSSVSRGEIGARETGLAGSCEMVRMWEEGR